LETPLRCDDDETLVSRILSGDQLAFEQLVERYHGRLFRVVLGILGDFQCSEDVCQEVFVKAYLKLADFKYRSRLSTWLYRIAVNTALKMRGKLGRRREVLFETVAETPVADGVVQEDVQAHGIEGEEVLQKVLRPLPAHLRAVVILKEREGLTYREISEVLACTRGAVEQRLHRAFCMLRDVWKDRGSELGFEQDDRTDT